MKLLSIIPNQKIMEDFGNSWKNIDDFARELGLEGIETMIGTYHPISYLEGASVRGLHLLYFPTWLDLWYEDRDSLIRSFGSEERVQASFGGFSREFLIDHYRKEFENAKALGVDYMVFHVSHVNPRDVFTFDHTYSSREIITAAAELINEVFRGEGPALLFENLFWPGLDLLSPEETELLLDLVDYENKGLLLDTSHLICARGDIFSYDEGARHILDTLDRLGPLRDHIRGIHLNASLPGEYLKNDFSHLITQWEEASSMEKYYIEADHIKRIDTHSVFKSSLLRDILEIIPYEFLTLELSYSSADELRSKVMEQLEYL